MNKHLAVVGVTVAVALAGVTGVGVANAATTNTGSDSRMTSLVQAVASKFNLKTTDVQAVFDTQRSKDQATRTAEVTSELKQLVSDGKLTQTQSDAILAKRAELISARDSNKTSMKDMTSSERKAAMDERKATMDAWFSDNNISTDYRYLIGGEHGGPEGHRGPDGAPNRSTDSDAS